MLSIITPVFNGRRFIQSYSDAIKNQLLEENKYEVIIVDNGSNDGTLDLLKYHFNDFQNVKILSYTEKQSSYAARNYGVSKAKGNVFAFTDIDCYPSMDWALKSIELTDIYKDKTIISGTIKREVKNKNNVFEYFDKTYFLDQESKSQNQNGATANMVVSKQVFIALGGFKEFTSGADTYFCDIAVKKGFDFQYNEKLIVKHPCLESFNAVKTKSRRIAFGIAEKHIDEKSNLLFKIVYYFLGAILNLQQFKKIRVTFNNSPFFSTFTLRFAVISLFFGIYIRINIILNIIRMIFKKRE
jgi:glycosyltransferase involved in cell wall biosynthesis